MKPCMAHARVFPLMLVSLLFLAVVTCAPLLSRGGGEIRGERTQLCIYNQSGSPVHVYEIPSGIKQGVIPGSRGCVKLNHEISQSTNATFLCVRTLESEGCEVLPPVVYGNVPTWQLELGPWPRTWYLDTYSLRPAPAAD